MNPLRPAARWFRHGIMPRLPGPLRSAAARSYGVAASAWADREIGRLAASRRPLLVGPWYGEVGFEVLYWIPFLRRALARLEVDPSRLTVISRGGVRAWYEGMAGGYLELFDRYEPGDLRIATAAQTRARGGQKAMRPGSLDQEIIGWACQQLGETMDVLHPSLMFRALRPWLWGDVGTEWARDRTSHRLWGAPPALEELPDRYVTAKFYESDALPASSGNVGFAHELIDALAKEIPVVLLELEVSLDDHGAYDFTGRTGLSRLPAATPSQNLAVQSAAVSHGRAHVGTYGGYAYLAPSYGVASTGLFSDATGFRRTHLELAHSTYGTDGFGDLTLVDVAAASPREVAASILTALEP